MQSSLWWLWEKSICSDETCRVFFLARCWRVPHIHRRLFQAPNRPTGRQKGFISTEASEKERRGRWKESERQNENLISPRFLRVDWERERIYSCLASSPSTRHVSLQLLTSLLHSITHCSACVCVRTLLSICVSDVLCPWSHSCLCNSCIFSLLSKHASHSGKVSLQGLIFVVWPISLW